LTLVFIAIFHYPPSKIIDMIMIVAQRITKLQ